MTLKTGFLRKILKVENKLNKVHLKYIELKLDEINRFGAETDLDRSWTCCAKLATHLNISERLVM